MGFYSITKKRLNMGLGTFPEVSLAQARKLTIEARELVAQGIDPKERRDADRQAKKAATEHTLQNVATSWYELKKDAVRAVGMKSPLELLLQHNSHQEALRLIGQIEHGLLI